jgi:hypothetical protein
VPWELAIKINSGELNSSRILGRIEQRVLGLDYRMQGNETAAPSARSLSREVRLVSRDTLFDL